MKIFPLSQQVWRIFAVLVLIIVVVVPFHAFLTVWAASIFGHYTLFRLWDEVLLMVISLGAAYALLTNRELAGHLFRNRLVWLIAAYALLQIIWGAVAYHFDNVSTKALGYAWIVNLRFLVFFVDVWILAQVVPSLSRGWQRVLLVPAAVVAVFAVLQFAVLPHDFLSHFGYGPDTIYPYETINHNINYIRVQSFLRGANPLGAYLLIPLSAVVVLLARRWRDWKLGLLLAAVLVALFFSFSRSAWIGAVITLAAIFVATLSRRQWRRVGLVTGVLVVFAVGFMAGFHQDVRLQNYLFHTQQHSQVKATSNQGHASALKSGLSDLAHQPFGRGPGTAGPASVYNNRPARIAENYFIQVGQEVGWLGLALFVAINAWVAYVLWQRRTEPLALALFASLLGITFVNLLSHAWADDTLAYLWWGLAGASFGSAVKRQAKRVQ